MKRYLRPVSVGVHRLHIERDGLHLAPVGDRGELQHSVEGTLQVGHLLWNKKEEEQNQRREHGCVRLGNCKCFLVSGTNPEGFMGRVVPTCTLIQEVGQQAAHDGLVADDQDVCLPLQVHDDRLHPLDQVLVGLQMR